MTTFKNMKDLEKYINAQAKESLKNDVSKKVVNVAKDRVQKDVYDVYPNPKQYDRTGKLKESFVVNDITNGIEIENTRKDGNREIDEIVEYGHFESEYGYEHAHYPYDATYLQPRPFIKNTKEQIVKENIHVDELKKSFNKKGIKTIN